MTNAIQPFHLLVIALAGWLNRQQQVVIDYLIEENRVLKEQLGGQRLRFTDEQRMRLAVKAKLLGRRGLDELETLVTPDTLLAWHRKLIAQKWTYARQGPGRPRVAQEITDLVLRMARENASWGYDRIQGAPANLGHIVAPNTVKNILKRHGIEPAPERGKRTSWTTFLKAHWDVMAATDFFAVEVWTPRGLVTYYVLFVIHLSTRSVHIAGVTSTPNGAFMKQVARNLTDVDDGFLLNSRYLHHGPRYKIHGGVQRQSGSRGCEASSLSGSGAELQCIRRTVCAFYKRGMFGSYDSIRRGIASPGTQSLCHTLSC